MSNAIEAQSLCKDFGKFHAIDDATITVKSGCICGFIGKNGAGKTTVMRMLTGLMKPSCGKILVLNENPGCKNTRIGFLPQNMRFDEKETARSVLAFFAAVKNVDVSESIQIAKTLELDLDKKVKDLSPGNQRKLQLIVVTGGNPELLILDEPTAGLDPTGVQQVREIIRLLSKRGCTVFVSSHILKELDDLCNQVVIIDRGRILYQGTCAKCYEFETGGLTDTVCRELFDQANVRSTADGNLLSAEIEKQSVPDVLRFLFLKNIPVYEVRRSGFESLYNRYVGEAAQ